MALGGSSIDDTMFTLAKREQGRAEFFRKAGAGGVLPPGPQTSTGQALGTSFASLPAFSTQTSYTPTFSPIPSPTTQTLPSPQTQTQTPQYYFDPNTNTYTPISLLPTGGVLPQPLWTPSTRRRKNNRWGTSVQNQGFFPQGYSGGRGNFQNAGRGAIPFQNPHQNQFVPQLVGRGRGRGGLWRGAGRGMPFQPAAPTLPLAPPG
jgi:hypothetical protein